MTKTIGCLQNSSSGKTRLRESQQPRVALVVGGIPNTIWGGGALTAFGIAAAFKTAGCRTAVFHWEERESLYTKAQWQLKRLGVEEFRLTRTASSLQKPSFLSRLKRCPDEVLFPFVQEGKPLQQALLDWAPDVVVTYHWEALAALSLIDRWPVCGYVGDPLDAAHRYWQQEKRSNGIRTMVKRWMAQHWHRIDQRQRDKMTAWLNRCVDCGAFAAHHAQEFRDDGAKHCRYVRTPLVDLQEGVSQGNGFGNTVDANQDRIRHQEIRFVLLGHMKGIATLTGLRFFFNEVFPLWLQKARMMKWSLHVIGDGYDELPLDLKEAMRHPRVMVRGHIWPIEPELKKATAMIVPTPVRLGIRVRILTAFRDEVAVITHEANCAGIPELEHGINAWVGRCADDIAEGMLAVAVRPDLRRRLVQNGRKTYETYFSLATAGRSLAEQALETIHITDQGKE